MTRRRFITTTGLAAGTGALPGAEVPVPHVATNVYPWLTFAKRRDRDWNTDLDTGLAKVAQTGIQGFEPIGSSPKQVRELAPLLTKHGLEMRSLYVNSILHEQDQAGQSIKHILEVAAAARKLGTRIIVTNPSPIKWGGPENKSDPQLTTQAEALDTLGASLRNMGMSLAYHNHDIELREGGREFHHMLTATDPENVKFCLDAHWVFRGCGNSEVALFDVVTHYHPRITELHLRQSRNGTWTEEFTTDGDIDYQRLFNFLARRNIHPHLVLEQAVEANSPDTMTAVEAHTRSRGNLLAARPVDR